MGHLFSIAANQIAMLTNGKYSRGHRCQLFTPLQMFQLELFGVVGLHDGVRYLAELRLRHARRVDEIEF